MPISTRRWPCCPTDMGYGIMVFGLNGAGKSTLAHALAKRLGYKEIDSEDYYFPEQRASRLQSLEGGDAACTEYLGDMPFSVSRTKAEVEQAMLADMEKAPRFVLAGVGVNWNEAILNRICLAVKLEVPLEERLERINGRELRRFGERVLPGGDMHARQEEFHKMVISRSEAALDESAKKLPCPVIRLDGRAPTDENIAEIIKHIKTGA